MGGEGRGAGGGVPESTKRSVFWRRLPQSIEQMSAVFGGHPPDRLWILHDDESPAMPSPHHSPRWMPATADYSTSGGPDRGNIVSTGFILDLHCGHPHLAALKVAPSLNIRPGTRESCHIKCARNAAVQSAPRRFGGLIAVFRVRLFAPKEAWLCRLTSRYQSIEFE